MKINMTAYVCVCERDGKRLWLCYDEKTDQPFICTDDTAMRPILFASEDEAVDALYKYTSFKGWTFERVRITNFN